MEELKESYILLAGYCAKRLKGHDKEMGKKILERAKGADNSDDILSDMSVLSNMLLHMAELEDELEGELEGELEVVRQELGI